MSPRARRFAARFGAGSAEPSHRHLQRRRSAAGPAGGRDDRAGPGGDRRPDARLAQRLPRDADPSLMSIGGERAGAPAARGGSPGAQLVPPGAGRRSSPGCSGSCSSALTAPRSPPRRRGGAGSRWRERAASCWPGGSARARSRWRASTRAAGDAVVKTIWNAYLGDLRTWSLGHRGRRHHHRGRRGAPRAARATVLVADPRAAARSAAAPQRRGRPRRPRARARPRRRRRAAGVLLYLGARHLLPRPSPPVLMLTVARGERHCGDRAAASSRWCGGTRKRGRLKT